MLKSVQIWNDHDKNDISNTSPSNLNIKLQISCFIYKTSKPFETSLIPEKPNTSCNTINSNYLKTALPITLLEKKVKTLLKAKWRRVYKSHPVKFFEEPGVLASHFIEISNLSQNLPFFRVKERNWVFCLNPQFLKKIESVASPKMSSWSRVKKSYILFIHHY